MNTLITFESFESLNENIAEIYRGQESNKHVYILTYKNDNYDI